MAPVRSDRWLKARLPPGLYVLCDDGLRPDLPLPELARQVLAGGAQVLQLRLKRTAEREAVELCREVTALCRAAGALCLINDRVDHALLSQAHGVHLGDDDLPPAEARQLLGPGAVIGVTTRNLEQIGAAARAGADYVGLGPVFATRTKQVNAPLLGLGGLERICRSSPLPVVAIAGLGLDNLGQVANAGAHGSAVGSDLLLAADLMQRTRALIDAFGSGEAGRV